MSDRAGWYGLTLILKYLLATSQYYKLQYFEISSKALQTCMYGQSKFCHTRIMASAISMAQEMSFSIGWTINVWKKYFDASEMPWPTNLFLQMRKKKVWLFSTDIHKWSIIAYFFCELWCTNDHTHHEIYCNCMLYGLLTSSECVYLFIYLFTLLCPY